MRATFCAFFTLALLAQAKNPRNIPHCKDGVEAKPLAKEVTWNDCRVRCYCVKPNNHMSVLLFYINTVSNIRCMSRCQGFCNRHCPDLETCPITPPTCDCRNLHD